ncbi:nucleoside-diphosphate kinase [Oceanirhabdus sp. W0125-5]|uniref:nucleoside-diphosphate kinase n=1 Tax=Oceanirhabdus sp. W0125-5 TaxID=2999116 RepID=UPI002FDCE0BE
MINKYERKGFSIIAGKLIQADRKAVELHYAEHSEKFFFQELIDYFLEGLVFVMVLEGENVIDIVRNINGDKEPRNALCGTIRGDYANSKGKNIVHASDSSESAEIEIGIWFPEIV